MSNTTETGLVREVIYWNPFALMLVHDEDVDRKTMLKQQIVKEATNKLRIGLNELGYSEEEIDKYNYFLIPSGAGNGDDESILILKKVK